MFRLFNDIRFKLTVNKRNRWEKYGFNSTKRQLKFRWFGYNLSRINKIMMMFELPSMSLKIMELLRHTTG